MTEQLLAEMSGLESTFAVLGLTITLLGILITGVIYWLPRRTMPPSLVAIDLNMLPQLAYSVKLLDREHWGKAAEDAYAFPTVNNPRFRRSQNTTQAPIISFTIQNPSIYTVMIDQVQIEVLSYKKDGFILGNGEMIAGGMHFTYECEVTGAAGIYNSVLKQTGATYLVIDPQKSICIEVVVRGYVQGVYDMRALVQYRQKNRRRVVSLEKSWALIVFFDGEPPEQFDSDASHKRG